MEDIRNDSGMVESLKSLHQVITKNFHSEDELFEEYLALGKEIFGLETGIVSKIEGDKYFVSAFSSPLEGLEVGQMFELKDTYCREVFEAKKTVAFPHVGAVKRMCDHPVYVNMKLESYISSPIFVHGEIYGTINFTDRIAKNKDFDNHQFDLIEIMAETIARFIESKIYKEDLIKAKIRINNLVGVVSHDLKNPIGNILSLGSMIVEETEENETKELVSAILKCGRASMEMINSILDISAIDSGKIQVVKSDNSTNDLVRDSKLLVDHLASKKNIEIVTNGDEFNFEFDFYRLKQSLCNLLSNSIKFSPRNSTITITSKRLGDEAQIAVKDEGVGIDEGLIEDIFDVDKTTSTLGTEGEIGTGYGLPLVSKIINLHGGKITINSEVGSGSTFVITLPIK